MKCKNPIATLLGNGILIMCSFSANASVDCIGIPDEVKAGEYGA